MEMLGFKSETVSCQAMTFAPTPEGVGGRRGCPLVASASVYLLNSCGGPCLLGRGFDGHPAAHRTAASEAGRAGPGLFITPFL